MAARHCDGSDDHLTRVVSEADFDPAVMTESANWGRLALQGTRVIRCQCGLSFDDEDRTVTWPHQPVGPKLTDEEADTLVNWLLQPGDGDPA